MAHLPACEYWILQIPKTVGAGNNSRASVLGHTFLFPIGENFEFTYCVHTKMFTFLGSFIFPGTRVDPGVKTHWAFSIYLSLFLIWFHKWPTPDKDVAEIAKATICPFLPIPWSALVFLFPFDQFLLNTLFLMRRNWGRCYSWTPSCHMAGHLGLKESWEPLGTGAKQGLHVQPQSMTLVTFFSSYS